MRDAAAEPGEAPGVGVAVRDAWGRWRPSVVVGAGTWLAGLAMYAVVTAVAWIPYQDFADHTALDGALGPPPDNPLLAYRSWYQWDTVWYVLIADHGYDVDGRSVAFFPLYPLLVRAVNPALPGGTFEAALLLSAVACLAALIVVHRLAADLVDGAVAGRTVFYLLAFPTGFFLVAAYPESLFLALAVGSAYCMRRGRWWWAGGLAALAGATRLVGVLLAVAFAYEYLRQRGFSPRRVRWDAAAVALVPLGLLAYAFYCARAVGDPLAFLTAQQHWYRTGYQPPWTTVWEVGRLIAGSPPLFGPDTMRNLINLTVALGVLALLVLALVGPWRVGPEVAYLVLFSALVILLPLVNPIRHFYPLSSMWRFALECLPAFLVLARLGARAAFDRVYLMTALGLQGAMIVTFVHSRFVA